MHKLLPDWLRRIDTVLEDEAVIEVVAQALEARWPHSRRRGPPGTPAEVVIRMPILKHLFDWSYDDLEQEVRANLVYRAFTLIDVGEVPDAKTILKIFRRAGAGRHRTFASAGGRGREAGGVTRGRRFRIDTTVVETTVHYPTDSTLLQDGVRVLTRTIATGEYRARRRAWSDSQSAAQRHAGRLDDWLSQRQLRIEGAMLIRIISASRRLRLSRMRGHAHGVAGEERRYGLGGTAGVPLL